MIFDMLTELDAIRRAVARGEGTAVVVTLTREYDAEAEDVWDALTDPQRLARWFSPVTGEFQVGGTFEVQGNASGEILRCDRPTWLSVTFGAPESVVDLRLDAVGQRTTLELSHRFPFEASAAEALYPGPGWDGAFLGLGIYLRGDAIGDPMEAANSPEVIGFNAGSIDRWVAAVEESGAATTEQLAEAREVAVQSYTVLPE